MVAVAGVVFRLRPIRLFELGLLIPDQPVWAVAGLEPGLIVSPPFQKDTYLYYLQYYHGISTHTI